MSPVDAEIGESERSIREFNSDEIIDRVELSSLSIGGRLVRNHC